MNSPLVPQFSCPSQYLTLLLRAANNDVERECSSSLSTLAGEFLECSSSGLFSSGSTTLLLTELLASPESFNWFSSPWWTAWSANSGSTALESSAWPIEHPMPESSDAGDTECIYPLAGLPWRSNGVPTDFSVFSCRWWLFSESATWLTILSIISRTAFFTSSSVDTGIKFETRHAQMCEISTDDNGSVSSSRFVQTLPPFLHIVRGAVSTSMLFWRLSDSAVAASK